MAETAEPAVTTALNGASSPRRDRIRVAAVRLFTRHGYEATSMKQLARELKMAPANLYNYYPNKQAILFEVINHQLQSVIARDRAVLAAYSDPVDQIRAIAYDLVFNDLKDPLAAFVGHHGLNGLAGASRRKVSQLMRQIRDVWVAAIQAGVDAGAFNTPDPKLSALTALTLCSFVSSWYAAGEGYEPEEVARHTAACVLRSFGYPEPL